MNYKLVKNHHQMASRSCYEGRSTTRITDLHLDIIEIHLLTKLGGQSLASLASTNRLLLTMICDKESLWKRIFLWNAGEICGMGINRAIPSRAVTVASHHLRHEILCRLPVKHLLRCGCVSKGWCSLIDSNAFVKKHLKRMIECNTRGIIFNGMGGEFYLADFDSLDDDSASVVQLDDSFNTLIYGAYIVGSANGLVCVVNTLRTELFLFNPSTRKSRKIPSAPSEFPKRFRRFDCGFGYDHVNDDYKVLKINNDDLYGKIIMVLYSLKTNEWTWIQNVPNNITDVTSNGICARGCVYFCAQNNHKSDIIIGFDFGLEQFEQVPFPGNETPVNFRLLPFEGSLCIILGCHSNSCIDVWVLNHSREDNHWDKAFSVELPREFGCCRPLAFSRSRKHVLLEMDDGEYMWYNFETKTIHDVKIRRIPTGVDCLLYTESLVQLKEQNKFLQNPSQDKHAKQKKRY
ncbi:F-box domain-containing protein [Heracleum sosnowskyi]|uniref:F-box domain-containing protein n=1 Tax=Heracleum sosnowskyi TaxID=360622 RepID=A0AAD8MDS6_9APIA|nr:F-box domain-containing protein [Heracleum sosnowskyi]